MNKTAEELLDELEVKLKTLSINLDKRLADNKKPNPENIKKNSHLHIFLETPLHNKLKKEAEEKMISISELARRKLRKDEQLDRIESKIDRLLR